MLLPTVMEFNRMVCRERFSQIGRALRTKKSDDRDAINAVSELIAEVGIGKRLGDVGATSAHYGAWAQAAQEDILSAQQPAYRQPGTDCRTVRRQRNDPDATLAASYPAYGIAHVGRIRRLRRIRQ